MLNQLRPAFAMIVTMTLLTGLAYPLAMTGLAQAIAPQAATGSLIERNGTVIGSALIAQGFTGADYLHPRPSVGDYATMPTAASNLSPTSAALADTVAARRAAWQAENGGEAPMDAVTASASGIDPHISPDNALGQAARIATARGLSDAQVRQIITAQTEPRWLGLYGQPRVNVLLTNLALDAAFPPPAPAQD